MMNKQELMQMVGGRFFHVTFIKKDGSVRNMNARLGVTKHLKGDTTINRVSHPTVVTCYDMQAKAYRAFDVNRVYNVTQGSRVRFGNQASSIAHLI